MKCVFLGYSIEIKGYQFYNSLTKQLIVNSDVVWSKSSAWNWKELQQCLDVIIEVELLKNEDSLSDDARHLTPRGNPLTPPNSLPSSPESPSKKVKSLMEIYEQVARCNFSQINEKLLFQDAIECKE